MCYILVAFDWIETGSASKDKMSALLSLSVRHNWRIVLLMIMAMARAIGQKSIYKTIDWPACLLLFASFQQLADKPTAQTTGERRQRKGLKARKGRECTQRGTNQFSHLVQLNLPTLPGSSLAGPPVRAPGQFMPICPEQPLLENN